MSFLKLRVIVNDKDIYPLLNNKPVLIPVMNNKSRLVATDGFHFTNPVELLYEQPGYYRFKVSCVIDDLQLLGGGFLLVLLYLAGFFTGIFLLKLLSFIPILWFLFYYYINRKRFIRIIPEKS